MSEAKSAGRPTRFTGKLKGKDGRVAGHLTRDGRRSFEFHRKRIEKDGRGAASDSDVIESNSKELEALVRMKQK